MICAVYCRKSNPDERTSEDGKSVERQRENATAFAAKKGWTVTDAHVYVDDGISGAEFVNRHNLQRLLRAVKQTPRPFHALVIAEPKTLGREQIETAYVLKQITDAGVEVWGYLDGRALVMTTSADKLMFSVQAMAAESERERGRQRTREALHRKARLAHGTGARTFGFTTVRMGEHVERAIHEAQATVVRRIFTMASEGLGDARIAHALTADGIPAPGPKGWQKETVTTVLKNRAYLGEFVYGKSRVVDRGGSVGKRVRVPESEWVTATKPELAIVPHELWDAVRERKKKTAAHYMRASSGTLQGKPESGLAAKTVLSGIARCACGGPLRFFGGWPGATARYHCAHRYTRGATACDNRRGIPMKALDEAVLDAVRGGIVVTPGAPAALLDELEAHRVTAAEAQAAGREDAEREIARLTKEIANLVAACAAGTVPEIAEGIAERRARIEALQVAPAPAPIDRQAVFNAWEKLRLLWLNARYPAQVRQLLRKMGIDRITVRRAADGASWAWEFEGMADVEPLVAIACAGLAAPPIM
jgi:site-specific DNA recombinase